MTKENIIIKNIRKNILKKTFDAKSSHIGSCFSIVEILYTIYFHQLKNQDTFILSKGHAALALYSTLNQKGILNIGGITQSVYDFAKSKNSKVKKIRAKKTNNLPLKQDMNLSRLKKILKK